MALFYEPSQQYLSKINTGGTDYLKAAKSNLDKFVTSGLADGKVAFQNAAETMYFCRSDTDSVKLSEVDIENNCIYDYEFVFDFSHGIALKADNGKYLDVPNVYSKFIYATSDSPVYFH